VSLICECGKRYKEPENVPAGRLLCPNCRGTLRREGTPRPGAVDLHVLLEQKKALRDELRVRDRQMRIAQAEIQKLKAELEKLRAGAEKPKSGTERITVIAAPILVDRSAGGKPLEMPDERLDFSTLPLLEELPDLADAPQLPSDRLTLYPAEPEDSKPAALAEEKEQQPG
jgi:hypothetical protein